MMKKLLLLLFLLVSVCLSAQVQPGMQLPYNVCDDSSNDGFAVFDLTSTIPSILSGVEASVHEVHFYPSETDAVNITNEITTPSAYTNITPGLQVLGIRIINTTTSLIVLSGMNLIVNPLPTANPATFTFCDPNELVIYSLPNADVQIVGGATNSSVSYHLTLADAETGANPLPPSFVPTTNVQILFARVVNQSTGCFSTTTLTLNTNTCEQCPAPINVMASNVTDTTLSLSWTNPQGSMGAIYFSFLILPAGSTAPEQNAVATSTGTYPGPFTITGLVPNQCYDVYVKRNCSTSVSSNWSAPLNICLTDCTNTGQCSEALILNAFLDSNNNGVKDTGEQNFNQGSFVYQVNDSGNNLYGNSNNGYYYIFDSNPANSYDINFTINSELSSYYTSAASYTNITLPDGSGANYLYFPVVNILPHVDAQVYLSPSGQPRPGFTYTNTIYYQNNGLQTIANGTLTFTHAPNISIYSVSQAGTTPTANGFTYDFTNLAPNESRYINVGLLVPTIPTVNLGDLVTNSVTIQITGDINPTNNSSSITQTIVGSYDPNDKMESHGGKIVYADFTANDYLYYTIQFENTGSASAEFIRVEDALNNQLDENTFEMISASHSVNTKRIGNQLTWHFYDINLPPTSSNPSGSHGFVSFRIKPKAGYAIGDIIPNTASIYFDYNPAIVTNTFNTEFVQALANTSFNTDTISLYPNPTNDRITITNNGTEKISKLTIYDVTGKKIYNIDDNSLDVMTIDVSHFAKGLYLVEIALENNHKVTKKLIIQ